MQRQRTNTEETEKQQRAPERRIHSGEGSISAMNRMRSQEDAKSRYGLAGWQQRKPRPGTQLELFGS